MTGISPHVLQQVSFQLSFTAMAGIALALPLQGQSLGIVLCRQIRFRPDELREQRQFPICRLTSSFLVPRGTLAKALAEIQAGSDTQDASNDSPSLPPRMSLPYRALHEPRLQVHSR